MPQAGAYRSFPRGGAAFAPEIRAFPTFHGASPLLPPENRFQHSRRVSISFNIPASSCADELGRSFMKRPFRIVAEGELYEVVSRGRGALMKVFSVGVLFGKRRPGWKIALHFFSAKCGGAFAAESDGVDLWVINNNSFCSRKVRGFCGWFHHQLLQKCKL